MKPQRVLVSLLAAVTLALSGGFLFVYLYRWEWNRAILSGIIFLAAEVAVIGWALNSKLNELGHRVDDVRTERISRHLASARDRPSTMFDWLSPKDSRSHVFVPILMGAGLVISGLAWLVEWLGRSTAGRLSDERLARDLSRLAPPRGGLLDDGADVLRNLRGPVGGRR
jgi:hypothetical protein